MARKNATAADPLEQAKVAPSSALAAELGATPKDASTMPQDSSDDLEVPAHPPEAEEPPQPNVGSGAGVPERAPGPDLGRDGRGEPNLPPPVAAANPKGYRVERAHVLSWGHQMLRLAAGEIIRESDYGPGAIERMRNAGVPLVEVAD